MNGEEFKSIRKAVGMSQREFAAYLKVGYSTLTKWETDVNPIPSAVVSLVRLKTETVKLKLSKEELNKLHKRLKELNKSVEDYVAGLIKATL